MRLEELRTFLVVAETGSFQKAAQTCGVSQPTVSRQVQSLEADLGVPLFHRAAQVKLTLAGETFLSHARKIWQEWQAAGLALSDLHQGKQQELCVAAIHSVVAYVLPQFLPRLCQRFPRMQLRVTALGSDRALKVLKDGLVDVAVVMDNPNLLGHSQLVSYPMYEEGVGILMTHDHPLGAYPVVPWEILARYPQVVFKDGYGMRRLVEKGFARYGLTVPVALELNTPEAFVGVIRQSQMVALLPERLIQEALREPQLITRPVVDGEQWRRKVVAVTSKDRLDLPPIAYFYELLRTYPAPLTTPVHL
ncbi:LysR family transcriptional regulator [Gloeomargarita lithophora Alchichica-D10]|uniref:LysR family transcriptional regulator n=1 Tax=Gloeomargarita lithophora Alchichica-D10 TaxID=1188229 RepID=A0A1J0ADS2_9CYAN|nr:LysR family transcriptional regulator [Gloeomargarita lithophora]APB34073.1 LysR family transcriptional regulator [Gloeomargarita lithophora Alchichica-D10]